jgi:hypothetical protein
MRTSTNTMGGIYDILYINELSSIDTAAANC